MDTNNERDTHFKNFAKLVIQELQDENLLEMWNPDFGEIDQEKIQRATQLISQRAYDLVFHTVTSLEKFDFATYILIPSDKEAFAFIHRAIAEMPDMNDLPKLP